MSRITWESAPKSNSKIITPIDKAYKSKDGHFYLQRKNDVLHLNSSGIINTLFDNYLTDADKPLIEITKEEFLTELRNLVFVLDLYQYFKPL